MVALKVVIDHDLPKKVDYVRLLIDTGVASFYFSMNGKSMMWFGKIAKRMGIGRTLTDSEYSRYRMQHPVREVLEENEEEVVIATKDGLREYWLKPHWILKRSGKE